MNGNLIYNIFLQPAKLSLDLVQQVIGDLRENKLLGETVKAALTRTDGRKAIKKYDILS